MSEGEPKRPRQSNLKQFEKGRSGNPGGRPKDLLTQAIRAKLTQEEADAIAAMLIREAKGGNLKAAEVLLDQLEGKARQALDLNAGGDRKLIVEYVDDWRKARE